MTQAAKFRQIAVQDRCALREIRIEEYERVGEPVPAELRAVPCGYLRWDLKRITNSSQAVERLRGHRDGRHDRRAGRLVGGWFEAGTLPLLVLTPAGREHCAARHLEEYRSTYPELGLSQPKETRWPA